MIVKMMETMYDEEGPSSDPNQCRSTNKRRSDSAASGSAKRSSEDDDQSFTEAKVVYASASKQHHLSPQLDGRSLTQEKRRLLLKEDYTIVPKPKQFSTETDISKKSNEADELPKLLVMDVDKSQWKRLDQIGKDFHHFEDTIRAWRPRKCQGEQEKKQKTSSQLSRKDFRFRKDLSKSGILVGEE
ncbi:hypothetical protein Tco_0954054 [Tanacetum coccineum]|uniref:Uncharacterized protein n=1 Tax=Tanacetum coccineum TaxID=301880 RepID=A0ABQ5E4D9_9ASTR